MKQVADLNSSTTQEWAEIIGATEYESIASNGKPGDEHLELIKLIGTNRTLEVILTNGEPVGEDEDEFTEMKQQREAS